MTLEQLPIGESATVLAVDGEGALRCRLLDMGVTPGTEVLMRKVAPLGDPIEIHLRGYELTLRLEDARSIRIVPPPCHDCKSCGGCHAGCEKHHLFSHHLK